MKFLLPLLLIAACTSNDPQPVVGQTIHAAALPTPYSPVCTGAPIPAACPDAGTLPDAGTSCCYPLHGGDQLIPVNTQTCYDIEANVSTQFYFGPAVYTSVDAGALPDAGVVTGVGPFSAYGSASQQATYAASAHYPIWNSSSNLLDVFGADGGQLCATPRVQ
jgi:hypothetical protein